MAVNGVFNDMNVDFLLTAKQQGKGTDTDGTRGSLFRTRVGQLFTADWKTELVLGGCCFNVTVGDAANAGGDIALITGGGAGTVIDSDQPELIVGVGAGYYMVPLFFQGSFLVDIDADAEVGNVVLFADTTQNAPASATATAETPISILGSGLVSSIARAYSAVTADITDPVASILLAYNSVRGAEVTAAGESIVKLDCVYDPSFPVILKGPCSVVACWGGTAAVTGLATFIWAEVPKARFE